ncbi:6682_t:CDS:2, partial [Funneliformis caledonium]
SQASVTTGTEAKGTVQNIMVQNTNFNIWESNGGHRNTNLRQPDTVLRELQNNQILLQLDYWKLKYFES